MVTIEDIETSVAFDSFANEGLLFTPEGVRKQYQDHMRVGEDFVVFYAKKIPGTDEGRFVITVESAYFNGDGTPKAKVLH